MICRHFLSKIKKNCKRGLSLVKLQLVKYSLQLKKNSFVGSFHWKTNTKDLKFDRISQRNEAVIVNVKHKFHLESR